MIKKKTKTSSTTLIVIGCTLLILFIGYIYVFVMARPFMGEITQDRPIIKILCEMQVKCNVDTGPYSCSSEGENKELEKWSGYKGCNESTEGYYSEVHYGRVYSYIKVESCNCGGLM